MDTTRLQENISAMVDGELPDCDVELTLAALASADGRTRWHTYQLIGDVLRADAAAAGLSGAFGARLASRLAQEAFPADPDDQAPSAQAPASSPLPSQVEPPPQAALSSSPSVSPSSPPSQPPGDSAAPAAVGTR
jgi:sigma-E factor negative regulatory protein RseA